MMILSAQHGVNCKYDLCVSQYWNTSSSWPSKLVGTWPIRNLRASIFVSQASGMHFWYTINLKWIDELLHRARNCMTNMPWAKRIICYCSVRHMRAFAVLCCECHNKKYGWVKWNLCTWTRACSNIHSKRILSLGLLNGMEFAYVTGVRNNTFLFVCAYAIENNIWLRVSIVVSQ